jgi:hypothetical protein
MARELTIQIRLTEEEHATIASQAKREGLGVGTYLRALALRRALEESPSRRGGAYRAVRRIQEHAKERGLDKLSEKEIDAEIKAAHTERHAFSAGSGVDRS